MLKEKKKDKEQKIRFLSELEKAMHELTTVEKKINKHHHQMVLRQFKEAQEALRKSAQELARARAKIRFENSVEIVTTMISDPRSYNRIVDLYKPKCFDRNRFGEFVQTIRMLERLGFEITDRGNTVPVPNSPIITSCPESLTSGEENTILGSRFGDTTGEIRIEAETEPSVFHPTILDWSNTAVRFTIPPSVKIPFSAQGKLTLKRLDPITGSNYWTDDPNTSINVELLTRSVSLYFSTDEYSDSGQTNKFWYDYKKNILLKSALLPPVYRLFTSSLLDSDGLLIKHYDNTYLTAVESGSKVELIEGLYESQNALISKLRITDDWYWDYTVNTEFYILVPEGYSVPNGWMNNR